MDNIILYMDSNKVVATAGYLILMKTFIDNGHSHGIQFVAIVSFRLASGWCTEWFEQVKNVDIKLKKG